MIGYALRKMNEITKNRHAYPVAFRVMWDEEVAKTELSRLAKAEHAAGSGITFSMHEVEIDPLPGAAAPEKEWRVAGPRSTQQTIDGDVGNTESEIDNALSVLIVANPRAGFKKQHRTKAGPWIDHEPKETK